MNKTLLGIVLAITLSPLVALGQTSAADSGEAGFVKLFDGQTLKGWQLVRGRGPGRRTGVVGVRIVR